VNALDHELLIARKDGLQICAVQRFAEPEYLALLQMVFTQAGQIVPTHAATPRPPDARMLRVGAYAQGGALVAWSWGWFLNDSLFYTANSGVAPAFTRQGLYQTLTRALLARASTYSATAVESKHAASNARILAIKQKMGFQELRREPHEELGELIVLGRALPLESKIGL
jgi:ribosomal protein S18 acetylase RimI-like enzyme